MRASFAIFAVAALLSSSSAHFSFVDIKSQIACNFFALDGINWLAKPILEGQPFSQWWMHGQVNCQSKAKGSFALPANGNTHFVMSSRVQSVPPPYSTALEFKPPNPDYVLTREEWGTGIDDPGNTLQGEHNIHAYTRDDTSGCALAIAYKNEVTDVNPEDFVVFTVVHDCPKRMREPIEVPNLPACPNGNCICAWFWLPKTGSGLKNFYMTPFVCHVEGASPTASPVDVEYAIPPRRCLDPTLCNFGPRQPAYWLGAEDPKINMPEDNMQSPNYSIVYGFREGAQHDIFVNTNPRRHIGKPIPVQQECNGKRSRITEPASWTDLTSPNCRCTAELQADGNVRIFEGDTPISTVDIGGNSGPRALVNNASFKAGTRYFPQIEGPLRLSMNDKCYLYVIDSKGVVVWESMYERPSARDKFVHKAFTGMSSDPLEWPVDGRIYIESPTTKPTSTTTRTSKPTSVPINMPITSKPTPAPRTSKPTLVPTKMPTTPKPTPAPRTPKPASVLTNLPTTSKPTLAPTSKPRTSKPTINPTSKPAASKPTSKPSIVPTNLPTSAKITTAPTARLATPNLTTVKPTTKSLTSTLTRMPSSKPTTSTPSGLPSTKPTTKAPTKVLMS